MQSTESWRTRLRQRPSRGQALSSPVLVAVLVSFSLLQLSFFLPYSADTQRSQSGLPDRPSELAVDLFVGHTSAQPVESLTILWVYFYGWLTTAILLFVAWQRPRWFDKALLGIPTFGIAGVCVLWWLLLFSGASGSRAAMGIAVVVMPVATCVITRSLWLLQNKRTLLAASWGHSLLCILGIFALRWCWYPSLDRPGAGCALAILSVLGLMTASWLWPARARFDWVDRSASPRTPQTTIWNLGVATTLTAVGLVYWRAIGLWQSAGG